MDTQPFPGSEEFSICLLAYWFIFIRVYQQTLGDWQLLFQMSCSAGKEGHADPLNVKVSVCAIAAGEWWGKQEARASAPGTAFSVRVSLNPIQRKALGFARLLDIKLWVSP